MAIDLHEVLLTNRSTIFQRGKMLEQCRIPVHCEMDVKELVPEMFLLRCLKIQTI